MRLLLATVLSLQCSAHAESLTAKSFFARDTLEFVLEGKDFPSFPSDNSHRQVTSPDEFSQKAFDRIPIFKEMGIQLKASHHGNVNMDIQRKFILLDPRIAEIFMTNSSGERNPSQLAMLLAHEGAHYVLEVYLYKNPALGQFVNADEEHASVDLIALEILRRSGFSKSEIAEMAEAYLQVLKTIDFSIMKTTEIGSDIRARADAIHWWLSQ